MRHRSSPPILIAYRRSDASAEAARIADRLAAHFGPAAVRRDVDVLHAGTALDDPVREAQVVLAVIGPRWTADLASGPDLAQLEIAAALAAGVPVIPVLVGEARMPSARELPMPLAPLASRNPVHVADSTFEHDVQRIIGWLEELPAHEPSRRPERRLEPRPGGAPVERLLRRAALAGVVPAPRDRTRLPPLRVGEPPEPAPYVMDAPLPRRRKPWRALAVAAVAGGVAYLLADRLLGLLSLPAEPGEGWVADDVACTVFAPPQASPGESLLVQAFVHLTEQADEARALALEMDVDAQRRVFRSLEAPVRRGSRLHLELRAPGLDVDDAVSSLVWRGRAEAVQFGVTVPPGASGTVVATLYVTRDAVPLGHVKFKVAVRRAIAAQALAAAAPDPEPQGEAARRYRAAFISYASEDRDEVLQRVQMLAAVGIRYFQDVLDLEPGDRWVRRLELGIDECDLFLLFWSSEAKRSEWVRREVRHALTRRGDDEMAPPEIRPVIIEGPPVIEPWEELAGLHFNDRLLYFMRR